MSYETGSRPLRPVTTWRCRLIGHKWRLVGGTSEQLPLFLVAFFREECVRGRCEAARADVSLNEHPERGRAV